MALIAQEGSIVGVPAAISDEPYWMSAIAWANSELIALDREVFCNMIAADPILSLNVLKILAAEARAARMAISEHL